jgi:ABC-type branched-subunit amino acid transport system ATPase component
VLIGANAPAGFHEDSFTVARSIDIVAIVVAGGMGSVFGAVIGTLWVVGLPTLFPNSQQLPLLTSGVGILVVLMYLPGGMVEIPYRLRDRWLRRLELPAAAPPPAPQSLRRWAADSSPPEPARETAPTARALRTTDIVVRFGARAVVDHVSIDVRLGEIVGLIGTNGAGKSTLMHAIGGYVKSAGSVELLGRDVTAWSPARRARSGLGRGFQHAGLFPDLTVRETVQVALERRHRSSYIGTLVGWPSSTSAEKRQRADAGDLLDLFGLGRYGDRLISEVSTGTRRITELAAVTGLGAQLLCLDEPTAGIAQRESEAFAPLLALMRDELALTLLVIDHDIPLVMSISDRVYCMEAGRVIASGRPNEVRDDPGVIASYLGTDPRAIARSDLRPVGAEATSD